MTANLQGVTGFPDKLPKWCGLTIGALTTAFGISQVLADAIWGHPNSTSALGFVTAPIAGVFFGGVAFVIGLCLRATLRHGRLGAVPAPAWVPRALGLTVMIGSVLFLLLGRGLVLATEAARQPRVIFDSARIKLVNPPSFDLEERVIAPVLLADTKNILDAKPLIWNGTAILGEGKDGRVVVSDTLGTTIASADLRGFDDINGLHAAAACTQLDGRQLLAVLVTMRANAARAMFLVFGVDGRVVYQHYLERRGGAKDSLYTGTLNGSEAMVVDLGSITTWTCAR